MNNTIYTATGCARCKITKRYMQANGIAYNEFDIKAEGKDAFAKFYRENRRAIFRDQDGVEFPVFTDGNTIRQGVSVIIGYLVSGGKLDGFIQRSLMHGEWIDGFDISGGDPADDDELVAVLSFLQKNGLKIQLTCNGKNSSILEKLLEKKIGHRLIMEVKGPARLYAQIARAEIADDDLVQSIKLATRFDDYRFFTTITPVIRPDDTVSYMTPEEIGETAKLIEEATGSKKHPYALCAGNIEKRSDKCLNTLEPLPSTAMFKYRTAARRYMVTTELEK